MLFSQNTIEGVSVRREQREAGLLPDESLNSLRVLYCSNLTPDYYGEYRLSALRRLP